jgi:hypothetical protein
VFALHSAEFVVWALADPFMIYLANSILAISILRKNGIKVLFYAGYLSFFMCDL